MFVHISPSDQDLSETLSSLNFATRVRGIELGPARKQVDTSEIQKMKMMLDKLRQESRSKDESIKKLEELHYVSFVTFLMDNMVVLCVLNNFLIKSIFLVKILELDSKMEQQHLTSKNNNDKVKDLENKLREQAQEFASHSAILHYKVEKLEKKLKEQQQNSEESILCRKKIKELENKIKEQEQQQVASTTLETEQSNREGFGSNIKRRVLRSLNIVNQQASQEFNLLKEKDASQLVKRKHLSTSNGMENSPVLPILGQAMEEKLAELDHTFGKKGKLLEEEIRDLAEERNSLTEKKRRPLYRKPNIAAIVVGRPDDVATEARRPGAVAPVAATTNEVHTPANVDEVHVFCFDDECNT